MYMGVVPENKLIRIRIRIRIYGLHGKRLDSWFIVPQKSWCPGLVTLLGWMNWDLSSYG